MSRSFDAAPAPIGFVVADGHIGALLYSGRITEALCVAERLRQAADLPGIAQLLSRDLRSVYGWRARQRAVRGERRR